jgi:hypothetical protein
MYSVGSIRKEKAVFVSDCVADGWGALERAYYGRCLISE